MSWREMERLPTESWTQNHVMAVSPRGAEVIKGRPRDRNRKFAKTGRRPKLLPIVKQA